ncbi:hypothetical protein CC2G_011607 [Coprinopsis cinerea AmutBmut pab1-1]|nr:hypothetical protein CC2G_011607 [Coprinopsis cinerea AmutBmut pab1-1]
MSIPALEPPLPPAYLPNELLLEIIQHVWDADLSPQERTHFFHTSLLVNKFWLTNFIHTTACNVYIPSYAFKQYYFALLRGDAGILIHKFLCPSTSSFASSFGTQATPDQILDHYHTTSPARRKLKTLCKSFTIQVHNPSYPTRPSPLDSDRLEQPNAPEQLISNTLYEIRLANFFPNLKRITLEMWNVASNDLFLSNRFVDFPLTVEELELDFRFGGKDSEDESKSKKRSVPRHMIEVPMFSLSKHIHGALEGAGAIGIEAKLGWIPTTLHNIKKLRITGGYEDLVRMIFLCANLEEMECVDSLSLDRSRSADGEGGSHTGSECAASVNLVVADEIVKVLVKRDNVPRGYGDVLEDVRIKGSKVIFHTRNPRAEFDEAGRKETLTFTWWIPDPISLEDVWEEGHVRYITV